MLNLRFCRNFYL